MITEIMYILFYLLLLRLFFQWNEKRLSIKSQLVIFFIELLICLISFEVSSYASVIVLIIIYHVSILFSEKFSNKNIFLLRFLQFIFIILLLNIFYGYLKLNIEFNNSYIKTIIYLFSKSIFHIKISLIDKILIILIGYLIVINEINHLIRYLLHIIKTEPKLEDNNSKINQEQLNRGKIIGIIERSLFMFFIITNNYSSIGFILAAKGFTRFKELNNKDFAEYVLIGTLLSSSLSIFIGFIINYISHII